MRINLPKATSTSDLSKFGDGDESRRDSTTTDHNDMTRESTGILSGVEKQLVEETIQKIVQEELRKAAEREQTDQRNRENVAPNERARAHFDRLESLESALENGTNGHHKQVDAKNGANGMERRGTSTTDEGHDSPSGKPPRVPSAAPQRFRPKRSSAKSGSRQPIEQQSQLQHANKDSFEFEDDDYPEPPELSPERVHHNGTVIERKELHPSDSSMASSKANGSLKSSLKTTKKVKMVVDPSKPLAMRNYHSDTGAPEEEESDEEFYRQSWENGAAGGRRQPGSPWPKLNTAERRYLHEKAIFQELTHLKRTQIQYGKVQEKILVRSLINNFCKMHALNPAHFKNYDTFYAWEKFLYDQLKLIYMEERDRISATGAFPHPPRTPTAVKFRSRLPKASPLHERIRELTRIYSSSTNSIRAPSVKKYQPRRDFVCGNGAVGSKTSSSAGGGGKRCECLGKHLLLS